MRRAVVVAALLLAGCGQVDKPQHSVNQDPRNGRVEHWEDCWDGTCYYDFKVCVGPDLLVQVDHTKRWFRKSEECKP